MSFMPCHSHPVHCEDGEDVVSAATTAEEAEEADDADAPVMMGTLVTPRRVEEDDEDAEPAPTPTAANG